MKKVLKKILFLFLIIVVLLAILVGIRYIKYKDLIGKYALVEGIFEYEEIELNLFSWTLGNEKDKEVSLWGTSGYDEGNYYYAKENRIHFRDVGYPGFSIRYRLEKQKDNIYLILFDDLKYIKIK